MRKTRENTELISGEARQKHEAEGNSMKRFNESEFVPSELTPEEQSEKPRKLDKLQKDKIAEYKGMGGSYREIANYMGLSPSTVYRA